MLLNALDSGIKELEFWDMTPGEVVRAIKSRIRVRDTEARERASYDYILANLIVKGVGITLGASGNFPSIEEAYPGVFDEMVKERNKQLQEQKMNLSAARFKQFAQSYNDKFKRKEVPKENNE